jgi:hypothetical protein
MAMDGFSMDPQGMHTMAIRVSDADGDTEAELRTLLSGTNEVLLVIAVTNSRRLPVDLQTLQLKFLFVERFSNVLTLATMRYITSSHGTAASA